MSFTIPLGPREDLKLSMSSSAPRVSDGWVYRRSGSFPNGFSTVPSHGKWFLHLPSVYITCWVALSTSAIRPKLTSAAKPCRRGHQNQEYRKHRSDDHRLWSRRRA